MIKNILKRNSIIAGLLCGLLILALVGQYALAQGVNAPDQAVMENCLETTLNYEIKDGRVILDFSLTNRYNRTKTLEFGSGQQFELVITDEQGEEVYRYSEGKFFTLALLYKDLQPGQSLQWQDSWGMTDKDGKALTSGNYRAEVTILAAAKDNEEAIEPSQFTAAIGFNLAEPAVQEFLPEGARFAASGQGSKNFLQIDLDNDASPEMAVFYQGQEKAGVVLLARDGQQWKLKDRLECTANSLEYAGFADLDMDAVPEVLLGAKGSAGYNELIIFKLRESLYVPTYKLAYDCFALGDLDKDGTLEIASLLRTDQEIPNVKLQVHSFTEKAYQVVYEREFEPGSYPDNVVIGAVREGQQAIFVDLAIGAHSGLTEIIIKENEEFKSALAIPEGDQFPPTFKPYPLSSTDINHDDIIEVGIQSRPLETDHLPMVAVPWINSWYQWDGKGGLNPEPVMQEYSNYSEDYSFIIPASWWGKFTIENRSNEASGIDSVHFVYLGTGNTRAELLTLHLIPKENWPQQEQEFINNKRSYLLLGENSKNKLVAELPQGHGNLSGKDLEEYQGMLPDQERVKRSFTTIRNETRLIYDQKGNLTPYYAKKAIKETAAGVIDALSRKDAQALAEFVHPVKGLRFTPYTTVFPERDLVFNVRQVRDFFQDQRQYKWGYYDGTGEEILLTPREYYDKFVYAADYANAEKIGYNQVLSFGNMLENQFDVYENAIVVEYYFSGFNPAYDGLDWRSLRLVFQEYEGSWKLVGLINNQWTI